MRRIDLALSCQALPELDRLIADLRPEPRPSLRLPPRGDVPLRIGRSPLNGLRQYDETVSRAHALLSYENGGWVLGDLGSMNGTYVNGFRIAGRTVVRPGDLVAFGRVTFRLAT